MRYVSLIVSAALLAFAPVAGFAADAAKTTVAAATPTASSAPAAASAPASVFSDAQRAEIESILKNYLVNKNPEVLMEAMQELQKREQADAATKSKAALATNQDKLLNNPDTPVGGNPKGSVTVVEFFDYQCGYCKMSEPSIEKLLRDNKSVKFIYKDFPILGPMSVTAAKASLASVRQDKYVKFHDALMSLKDHLNEDLIYKTARDAGLDIDRLKKDMNDDAITRIVEANVALGTDIGARGTPTFVINGQVYPGALEYEQLKKAVDEAGTAKKP